MPLNGQSQFQDTHYDEMLAIVRDTVSNTKCDMVISTLHTLAPQAGRAGTKSLPQLFEECLSALRSLEARKGRDVLRPVSQDGPDQRTFGGQRGQHDTGTDGGRQERRYDNKEEEKRPPRLSQLTRMDTGATSSRNPGNAPTHTSKATGRLPLNGPAPEDAPQGCKTLREALSRTGRCWNCMKKEHHPWYNCPHSTQEN